MTETADTERLARIEGKLDLIVLQVTQVKDTSNDHESRLRVLERWRYSLPLGLGAAGGVGFELIAKLAGGG
ncbi:hypothetical protein [Nonomuraea sp. 10N515B]|uniref:hypothetical protein n=1 Tax=Nonomuraea sp. 10N515B TaxID=3457422 RepID=UPI003FCD66A7